MSLSDSLILTFLFLSFFSLIKWNILECLIIWFGLYPLCLSLCINLRVIELKLVSFELVLRYLFCFALGELMSLVLKHDVFEFDMKFYLQIQGTAMGTKMAPAYANLFTGRLEAQLINQAPESIHTWKRFIDDIFIIWTGTTEE